MTRKICLLIDDDPDERDIFEMALSDAGSPVDLVFVIDPSVAVKALKIGLINPDYIFIDINMPKLNGWETLKHLDEIENLAFIPIAMYSTSIPPEMPVVVDNLKVVRMISKTPGISELGARFTPISHRTKSSFPPFCTFRVGISAAHQFRRR